MPLQRYALGHQKKMGTETNRLGWIYARQAKGNQTEQHKGRRTSSRMGKVRRASELALL